MNLRHCCLIVWVCAAAAVSAKAPAGRGSLTRYLELRKVPLVQGERIESIEVTIGAATVLGVSIPLDWRVEVSWPDAIEGTTVQGEAGHGASWLDSGEELGAFLTLGFDNAEQVAAFTPTEDVAATIVTWRSAGEICRTSTVPAACFFVVDQPTAPRAAVGATNTVAPVEPAGSPGGPARYGSQIRQAEAELKAGRPAGAARILAETAEARRSFEYHYLLARARPDAGEGGRVQTVPKPDVEYRCARLDPSKPGVVFVCRDGSLRIFPLDSPGAPAQRVAHEEGAACWSGVFSRDGRRFFSGHQNGDVLVWNAEDWKLLHRIPVGGSSPVGELAAAPDGSAFVAEARTNLTLWSLAGDKPAPVAGVGPRYNFGEGLAFSPRGDRIASGGLFDILVFDARTGEQVHRMRHASYTMGLAFSPDGRRIASAPRGNVNKFLAIFEADAKSRCSTRGHLRTLSRTWPSVRMAGD